MSVGSYGHPDLCASPCIRAAYAKCVKGFFCQFCHLGHQKPKSKLNKNERELFGSLNETEVLSVVLLLLREKCVKLPGQQQDALRLLLSSIQRRVNLGNVGTRQMDFALRPMRRFSIGRLIDIIQQCHQVEQDFKLELKWLTEKARAEVDQARASWSGTNSWLKLLTCYISGTKVVTEKVLQSGVTHGAHGAKCVCNDTVATEYDHLHSIQLWSALLGYLYLPWYYKLGISIISCYS